MRPKKVPTSKQQAKPKQVQFTIREEEEKQKFRPPVKPAPRNNGR